MGADPGSGDEAFPVPETNFTWRVGPGIASASGAPHRRLVPASPEAGLTPDDGGTAGGALRGRASSILARHAGGTEAQDVLEGRVHREQLSVDRDQARGDGFVAAAMGNEFRMRGNRVQDTLLGWRMGGKAEQFVRCD